MTARPRPEPGSPGVAASGEVLLEMRGVGKRFGAVVALADVDVTVRRGEIHSIVGQNGAGKSTLMHILAGIQRADAGRITLDGKPVDIAGPAQALALALGIVTVYQELTLLPNLTVAENVLLGRKPRRGLWLDRAAMRERTRIILDSVGAGEIPDDIVVGALPLAQRQLVEIARALSSDPRLLILDEPTAALGRDDAERLFGIAHMLKSRGVSIIFISHRFAEVLRHCDRAAILLNGRVAETLDLAGVTEADLAVRMIGTSTEARFWASWVCSGRARTKSRASSRATCCPMPGAWCAAESLCLPDHGQRSPRGFACSPRTGETFFAPAPVGHRGDQRVGVEARTVEFSRHGTVAQHGGAIAHRSHFGEAVCDVDHRHAARPRPSQHQHQPVDFRPRQRGRRFVGHQYGRAQCQRAHQHDSPPTKRMFCPIALMPTNETTPRIAWTLRAERNAGCSSQKKAAAATTPTSPRANMRTNRSCIVGPQRPVGAFMLRLRAAIALAHGRLHARQSTPDMPWPARLID